MATPKYGFGYTESAGRFADIQRQLSEMGLGEEFGWGNTRFDKMSGSSLSEALARKFGITEKMPGSMFDPISRQQTEALKWETYQPQLQQQQQTIMQSLLGGYGSKEARQAGGGFADSTARQQYQTGIKDVYGRGMTGAITDVTKQRTQAYGSIQDTIAGWTQQAQRFKTGG
jgi:hypothetical protein